MKIAIIGDNSELVKTIRNVYSGLEIVNIADIKSFLSLNKLIKFEKILWFVGTVNNSIISICKSIIGENFNCNMMVIYNNKDDRDKIADIPRHAFLLNNYKEDEKYLSILEFINQKRNNFYNIIKVNDEISLNLNTQTLIQDNLMTLLPGKEFELMCFFLENRGRFVTVEQILLAVWDEFSTPENARQYIYKLRKKLVTKSKNKKVIIHKKGIGYLLLDNTTENEFYLS